MEYSSGVKVMFYLQIVNFFIFRFDVHVTPMVDGFIGFYLISLEYTKIQNYNCVVYL